ncbi:PP2C family protein-serine/threonine phosphatase [Megalodesulfovibrio paquesii]
MDCLPCIRSSASPGPVPDAAGETDRGLVRPSNQDAFFVDADAGLFIVSDGMGGANCGEVASAMTVACLRRALLAAPGRLQELSPRTGQRPPQTLPPDPTLLLQALAQANAAVLAEAESMPRCHGMGATAAVVLLSQGYWLAANVGDSPIYLRRESAVLPLFTPHTLAALLAREDLPAAPEVRARAQHVLTRVMGVEPEVEPDVFVVPAQEGDVLCLCSDGLSNTLAPEAIMQVCATLPASQACSALVALAKVGGGEDNITAVVCKLGTRPRHGVRALVGQLYTRLHAGLRRGPQRPPAVARQAG